MPSKKDDSIEEKEDEIINEAIAENTRLQKEEHNEVTPEVNKIIKILEEYLIKKQSICYGGTAINNILPKLAQFYNREKDVPDYDFYTKTAYEDCLELADLFYSKGYTEVEAKSGFHYNTFKVFVNQIPIADITYLEEHLFNALKKESIKIAGIYYSAPNWLRMNMHLELSRSKGYVDRWAKVYKRLSLLNKYHPLKIPKPIMNSCTEESLYADSLKLMPVPDTDATTDTYEKIHYLTRDSLISQKCVFFGSFAASFYLNEDAAATATTKTFMKKTGNFNVFHENIEECAKNLQQILKDAGIAKITTLHQGQVIDVSPETIHVLYAKEVIASICRPVACHNWNELTVNKTSIRIATIDTMLNFLLLLTFINPFKKLKQRFLCISSFLFDLEEKIRVNGKGIFKRFTYTCIGEQPTLESVRLEKTNKHKELAGDPTSLEYKKWFLKYNPADKNKPKKNAKPKPKPSFNKSKYNSAYSHTQENSAENFNNMNRTFRPQRRHRHHRRTVKSYRTRPGYLY